MSKLASIDQAFAQALQDKAFSGAQVLLGKGKETLFRASYGKTSSQPSAPVVNDKTLFDVASLTKPVVTTTLILRELEKGTLYLEDPVQEYLPDFSGKEEITIAHLLAHNAGLPAWRPLFEKVSPNPPPRSEVKKIYLDEISETPLEAPVGERRIYSDLGFILLGFLLEEIHGKGMEEIFYQNFADPVNLNRSFFNPLEGPGGLGKDEIAATEECSLRQRLLQGEVQDENAFFLGGVAGHAGLFSPGGDLELFIHFLWDVLAKKNSLVGKETLQKFIGQGVLPKLGWDTVSRLKSQAGQFFSTQAIGHLAFTGCSLWIDLADQKYLILLTNRVHPSRDNEAIKEFRPRLHDLLLEAHGLTS